MDKNKNITEAEWPIMCVLWEKGTATSAEIIDVVMRERDVTKRTLKALINRLIVKKRISFTRDEVDSRVYHYTPLVTKEEAVITKNKSFLGVVYQNDPMSLLTNFVKNAKLSTDDITHLYALLKEKEKDAADD